MDWNWEKPPPIDCSIDHLRGVDQLLRKLEGMEKLFYPSNKNSELLVNIPSVQKAYISRTPLLGPNRPTQSSFSQPMKLPTRKQAEDSEPSKISFRDPRMSKLAPRLLLNSSIRADDRTIIESTNSGIRSVKRLTVSEYSNKLNKKELAKRHETTTIEDLLVESIREKAKEITVGDIHRFDFSMFSIEKQLPFDILTCIFEYLRVKDIKSVRRVNKCWYKVANQHVIRKKERLIFNGLYTIERILNDCLVSTNNYMNLEFHRMTFNQSHSDFFKYSGDRIRSLHFVDCIVDNEVWMMIFSKCNELEQLSLAFYYINPPHETQFCKPEVLAEIVGKNMIQKKLKKLFFHQRTGRWISNIILKYLFIIFPNISKIAMACTLDTVNGCSIVAPGEISEQDLYSSQSLTFSSILHKICERPNSMEKLILDVKTKEGYPGLAVDSIMKYSALTSLRVVDMNVDLRRTNIYELIKFLTSQNNLKDFSSKFFNSKKHDLGIIMDSVIENCLHLKILDLTCKRDVVLQYRVMARIIASDLRRLSINVTKMEIVSDPIELDEFDLKVNSTMKDLRLSSMPTKYTKLMLQTFQQLNYLELENVNDEILMYIWKYQTNLKYLNLCDVSNCTTGGFSSTCSFSRLEKLEALTMRTEGNTWKASPDVFNDFVFPNLRCVWIELECNTPMSMKLLSMLESCKLLEYVSVDLSDVPRPKWTLLSSHWNKLRYFKIKDTTSTRFKRKEYEKFFSRTGTMRAFSHSFKDGTELFYWNVIDKRVERKEAKTGYRISSERIAGIFIDWLKF